MPLTDSKIRNTKPSTSPFKLTDAHGLYLLINPGGSRLWYLKYHFTSKESRIALGSDDWHLQDRFLDPRRKEFSDWVGLKLTSGAMFPMMQSGRVR